MLNSRILYYIIAALALLAFYVISFFTPMHSDDYAYAMKGLSLQSHYNHYVTWSGRVVADYISTILLSIKYKWLSAFISAGASSVLIVLISAIARSQNGLKSYHWKDSIYLVIIFCVYWVSSPSLGQTTFWIVGQANYLWTNLLILSFLFFIIKMKQDKLNPLLIALGILAGCSNENTGFCAVLFPILFSMIKNNGKINKASMIYACAALIGFVILISSPGNYARASLFADWNNLSFTAKLSHHVVERIPVMLSSMWFLFCISFILSFAVSNKKSFSYLSIIFLVFAMLSMGAMFAAPWYSPRSGNGTFVFLLCGFSIILYKIDIQSLISKTVLSLSVIMSMLYFSISYSHMFTDYKSAQSQWEVSHKIILNGLSKHKKKIDIPSWNFNEIKSDREMFDIYHDKWVVGKYYNIDSVSMVDVGFDYSDLNIDKPISISVNENNDAAIAFTSKKSILIISDKKITDRIFIHVYKKNTNQFKNYDFNPKNIMLNDKYWNGRNINLDNCTRIDVGTFNSKGRQSFKSINC